MTEAVLNKYGDCFRRLLPVLHASFPVQHPSDDSIVQTNFLETAKMQLNQMSSDTRKLRLFPFSAGRAHHLSTLNERVAADSAGQKNIGASFPSPDTADFFNERRSVQRSLDSCPADRCVPRVWQVCREAVSEDPPGTFALLLQGQHSGGCCRAHRHNIPSLW